MVCLKDGRARSLRRLKCAVVWDDAGVGHGGSEVPGRARSLRRLKCAVVRDDAGVGDGGSEVPGRAKSLRRLKCAVVRDDAGVGHSQGNGDGASPPSHRTRKAGPPVEQKSAGKRKMGVRDKVTRNGAPHAQRDSLYSKPEERKRMTGSATGTGSRRKIHRATAIPRAA